MGNHVTSAECDVCGAGKFCAGSILKSVVGVLYMKIIGGFINLANGEMHGNGSAFYNNAKFVKLEKGSTITLIVE